MTKVQDKMRKEFKAEVEMKDKAHKAEIKQLKVHMYCT